MEPKVKNNKRMHIITIISFLLCIFLFAILGILYVNKATPQKLLSKLGFPVTQEKNDILLSWENCLNQLEYDADIVFIGDSLTMGENFQDYFKDKKSVNLGLSGDSVYELSGEINPEYTKDGLHLKDEYKHLWLNVLSDHIK